MPAGGTVTGSGLLVWNCSRGRFSRILMSCNSCHWLLLYNTGVWQYVASRHVIFNLLPVCVGREEGKSNLLLVKCVFLHYCIWLCVCLFIWLCVCVYMFTYLTLRVCVHMFVCVYVCLTHQAESWDFSEEACRRGQPLEVGLHPET